jgi:hypothetical protein
MSSESLYSRLVATLNQGIPASKESARLSQEFPGVAFMFEAYLAMIALRAERGQPVYFSAEYGTMPGHQGYLVPLQNTYLVIRDSVAAVPETFFVGTSEDTIAKSEEEVNDIERWLLNTANQFNGNAFDDEALLRKGMKLMRSPSQVLYWRFWVLAVCGVSIHVGEDD